MNEQSSQDKVNIGLLVISFDHELGPIIKFAKSDLSNDEVMFLGLKGYTALMMGLDYDKDRGRIRGSLPVPNTEFEAIAFDLIFTDDKKKALILLY